MFIFRLSQYGTSYIVFQSSSVRFQMSGFVKTESIPFVAKEKRKCNAPFEELSLQRIANNT